MLCVTNSTGLAVALPQLKQHDVHVVARNRIERAEWLIHQEDAGIADERAAERDPLSHAAGELARPFAHGVIEPDEPQKVHRPAHISRTIAAHDLNRKKNVLQGRFPGQQGRTWNTMPISARGCVITVPPARILPSVTALKTGDHHQQGAFAAATGSEQADEFAFLDAKTLQRSQPRTRPDPFQYLAYALTADFRLHPSALPPQVFRLQRSPQPISAFPRVLRRAVARCGTPRMSHLLHPGH